MTRKRPSKTMGIMLGTTVALIAILVLMLLTAPAFAEQTVKTIEGPLIIGGDLDHNAHSITADREEAFIFNPPDGVAKVLSVEVMITLDSTGNTEVFMKARKVGAKASAQCNPLSWTIPNANQYVVYFDCSDVVIGAGEYVFEYYINKKASNVYSTYRITYYNKPTYEIKFVHGTDYEPGEDGLVFLQLLDEDNYPINDSNSSCYASIYYPFGTVWKYQQLMSYSDEGLFYYTFNAPYISGVYMVSAFCILPGDAVTNATGFVYDDFETGNISGGYGWSANWSLNGSKISTIYPYQGFWSVTSYGGSTPFSANRTFQGNSSHVRLDYSFYWTAVSLEVGDYFYVWMIDANGTANLLLSKTDGDDDGVYYHATGSLYNTTPFAFDGNMTFKINTTAGWATDDYWSIDAINLTLNAPVTPNETTYQVVRGSGEVHVVSDEPYIGEWTAFWMNMTAGDIHGGRAYGNYTVTSLTPDTRNVDIVIREFPYYYCADIQNFSFWNETLGNWQEITSDNYTCARNVEIDEDELTLEWTLSQGEILVLSFDLNNNYWRLTNRYYELANGSIQLMGLMCGYYSYATGQPLASIPINSSYVIPDDDMILWCDYTYDAYYYLATEYAYMSSLNMSKDNYPNNTANFALYQSGTIKIVEDLYPTYDELTQSILDFFTESALYDNERINAVVGYPILHTFGNLSTNNIIREELEDVNITLHELNATLDDDYKSIIEYLVPINSTIQIMNDTVYNIWAFQLNELSDNLTEMQLYLQGINGTVNDNYIWLTGMVNLSASEVWSFGTRTLTDYNQSEIIALLSNINETIYNLTIGNVTVSASVNWTEGAVKMSNISDPIIVESQLLTFAGRDETPIETISRSYCLDNATLAYDRNTTKCWLDQCYTVNDTLTEVCDYGCYQGACNPEPFDRMTFIGLIFLFVIVVIVGMAFAYDRFVK